ncbi:MAG: hypothetical protein ACI810_000442 [Gammaproteobacteria bacterium]|jgi:hypothetical protein
MAYALIFSSMGVLVLKNQLVQQQIMWGGVYFCAKRSRISADNSSPFAALACAKLVTNVFVWAFIWLKSNQGLFERQPIYIASISINKIETSISLRL